MVIADAYAVVRERLSAIINGGTVMCVVVDAEDWPTVAQQVLLHRPEMAVLDVRMPGNRDGSL